jgi:TPR repeat-containing protein TP_0920
VPPDARISLAKTLYAMGRYVPALLQLRAAARLREPEEADRILAGRIYFAQRMLDEAEAEFQTVLEVNPSNEEAFAELGGIYYRAERYEDLQRLLQKVPKPMMAQSSFLANLEGHLFHALGKHAEAAEAYWRAFTISPDQGLFAFHQANELYDCGKKSEAVDAYMQAARAFLQHEAYDDLAEVITILERIAPNDPRTLSIAGKYAYAVGRYDDALLKLKNACKKGSGDSADWYLYGLLLKTDEPKAAIKALKKACELEPEYGLYQFRLAEALFLSNGKYQPALKQALAADPHNGWVHNLRALAALSENDIEQAEAAVAEARRLLPDEVSLLVNYLEVQRRKGQLAQCLPLFDIENGTADLAVERNRAAAFHALANAFAADDSREEAQQWYYKALKLDPKNPELLTDKAENDAALFLLNEADDGLVKALDIQPSVRIYQLIASISVQKGDYARAEVTLRAGLESFANSADLHYDLACVYRNTNRFEQAQAQVAQLKQYETSARVDALERAILQATGATVQEATSKEEPSTAEPAGHAKKKKVAPTQSAAKSKSAEASKQTASATSAASKKNAGAIEPTAADEVGAKTGKAAAKKPRTKKTAGNL